MDKLRGPGVRPRDVAVCMHPSTQKATAGWLAAARRKLQPAAPRDRLGAQSGPAPRSETRQTQSTSVYSPPRTSERPDWPPRAAFHRAQPREASEPHRALSHPAAARPAHRASEPRPCAGAGATAGHEGAQNEASRFDAVVAVASRRARSTRGRASTRERDASIPPMADARRRTPSVTLPCRLDRRT
ncbi:hypothetical protein HETIRDRAFT_455644 [Heterobasidion irregulare TC 32-1]|uniref:Uncharacterized protein n=1 Tax=Heterobasidion irregulare (strain TC 32-1) TaxID=747525 RepID=W4JR81_HETIT|nr:uncharacterized protein HETIRDRAFT_455644 [Heterobasidion irregulare TC 32-1]ETW76048.1 hypothetical protein HETIRDRAFT_455644 [Heterobasidion irregulare TC 32-1]